LDESPEVLDAKAILTEQAFHGFRPDHRQAAFENNSVKTGQDTAKGASVSFGVFGPSR
jgi:hypothetical protein